MVSHSNLKGILFVVVFDGRGHTTLCFVSSLWQLHIINFSAPRVMYLFIGIPSLACWLDEPFMCTTQHFCVGCDCVGSLLELPNCFLHNLLRFAKLNPCTNLNVVCHWLRYRNLQANPCLALGCCRTARSMSNKTIACTKYIRLAESRPMEQSDDPQCLSTHCFELPPPRLWFRHMRRKHRCSWT